MPGRTLAGYASGGVLAEVLGPPPVVIEAASAITVPPPARADANATR